MSQLVYMRLNNTPKISSSPFKNDWNEYQHLSTQGRYIEPKIFSGFQNQHIKLTTVKRQLYHPKLPTIRRIERDEVLCRLSDEHCRHTTSLTEEKFHNFDPKRDESFIEFSGLNWHNTGKTLLGVNDSSFIQPDSSLEFGARLRADKSQKDSRLIQTKFYRSSSSLSMSPSTTLTKPIKYIYRNFGSNTFDQSSRTRSYLNAKSSYKPSENIFRSSSMYADASATPWNLISMNDGSKSSRI